MTGPTRGMTPETSQAATRVLVVDDQEMVRAGFRLLLEQVEDIEVVGEAADGRVAVEMAARLRPDVVLMDVRMPHLDGLSATRDILAGTPGTRVIVLTTFDVDDYVFSALRIGASGFLLKSSPPERLLRAIRLTAAGDALLDPSVTRRVIERFGTLPEPAETRTTGTQRGSRPESGRSWSRSPVGSRTRRSRASSSSPRQRSRTTLRDCSASSRCATGCRQWSMSTSTASRCPLPAPRDRGSRGGQFEG